MGIQMRNTAVIAWLICVLIIMPATHNQSIGLTLDTYTVNANAKYTFSITDGSFLTNSGTVSLQFNSTKFAFNVTSFNCSQRTSGLNMTCTVSNNNTVSFSYPGPLTVRSSPLVIDILNVKNPPNNADTNIFYSFTTTNGTTSLNKTLKQSVPFYRTGTLSSCSIAFSPNTVGSTGQAQFTLTLGNAIDAGGDIQLIFPTYWQNVPDTTTTTFLPSPSSQGYVKISSSSYLATAPTSIPTFNNITTQLLSLVAVANTSIPAGATIQFGITNLNTPSSLSTANSVEVITKSAQGLGNIDDSICYVTGMVAQTISNLQTTPTGYIIRVGQNITFPFQFIVPVPLISNDLITLSVSSTSLSYAQLTFVSGSTIVTNSSGDYVTASTTNSTSLTLTLNVNSLSQLPTSTSFQFVTGVMMNALLNSGVRTMDLTLSRTSIMASSSFTFTVLPNMLSSATVSAAITTVSTTTTYTFGIVTTNPLGMNAVIVITLPPTVTTALSSCSPTITSSNQSPKLNTVFSCTVSSGVITISNINSVTLPSSTNLTISLPSITNPPTTKPSSLFSIATYYNSSLTAHSVDDTSNSSTLIVTSTVAQILQANATSANSTVNANSIYTVSWKVNTVFPAGGIINITLPTEISITGGIACSFILTYTNGSTTPSAFLPSSTSTNNSITTITLTNLSPSTSLPSGTIIKISISTLRNPPSFKTSSSFSIYTYSSDNYVVEQILSGSSLTITNTATCGFPSLSASAVTPTNGITTPYIIQIQSPVLISPSDYFTILVQNNNTIDTQMALTASPTCTITYINSTNGSSTTNATCSLIGNNPQTLKVVSPVSISTTNPFSITIASMVLSRTMLTPGSLLIQGFASGGYSVSSQQVTPTPNNATNSIAKVVLSIVTSPSYLNTLQSFTITVTTTIPLNAGDYLIVSVPTIYSYIPSTTYSNTSGTNLCPSGLLLCSHYSNSAYLLQIQQLVSGSVFSGTTYNVSFTISPASYYCSPQTWSYANNPFTATSYSKSAHKMDDTSSSTDVASASFYTCNTGNYCKNCNPDGSCSACYSPGTGQNTSFNYSYIYITSDNKCVSNCTNLYFVSGGGLCTACGSPCANCSGTASNCTSCFTNSTSNKYTPANNTCTSSCSTGYYYNSSYICLSCSTTCYTCNTTASNCTSCISSYLYNNTCVNASGCPSNMYADTPSNSCLPCGVSCTKCVTNPNYCTQCATGYIYLSNTTTLNTSFYCTDQCPTGTVNDTAHNAGCRCDTTCKTCSVTLTNCTSCPTNQTLYNNLCYTSCPPSTYLTVVNSVNTCVACPSNCNTCNSSGCTVCNSGYAVYNLACRNASSCPSQTSLATVNGVPTCLACPPSCTACTTSGNTTSCTTCQAPNLLQSTNSINYCVSSCDAAYVNYLGQFCQAACPSGYTNVSGVCQLGNSTNPNTNTNQTVTATLSTSKIIPFPITITLAITLIICLASKITMPMTLVSCSLCAFAGLLQFISWIILIIVILTNASDSLIFTGMIIVFVAVACSIILNIVNARFINKYIWNDQKFQGNYKRIVKKGKIGQCSTWFTYVVSAIITHKYSQIYFSNLFNAPSLSYKVTSFTLLTPFNIVRYISLVPSLLAVVGAGIINYDLQAYSTRSVVFVQSVDTIIVGLIAMIAAIWVTNRNQADFQKEADLSKINQDMDSNNLQDDINQQILQYGGKKGDAKNYNKKYNYTSSVRQGKQDTHQGPLNKKNTNRRNPIGEQHNTTSNPFNVDGDDRVDLNDPFGNTIKVRPKKIDSQVDISEIMLDEGGGDQSLPMKSGNNRDLTYKQKKSIKDSIEGKLNSEELQKTKAIKKADNIQIEGNVSQLGSESLIAEGKNDGLPAKIAIKKQKLSTISNVDPNQLKPKDRQAVGQIKNAMNILQAKKIKIEEYLLYLDIIQEMDEENGSQDLPQNRLSPKGTLKNGQQKGKSGKNNEKAGKNANSNIKDRHKKKTTKKDISASKRDNELVVNYQNNGNEQGLQIFDQEDEPQLPVVDLNAKRTNLKRYNTETQYDPASSEDFEKLKAMKKGNNNRSEQGLMKRRLQGDDMMLVNVGKGDLRRSSESEHKGSNNNILSQHQRDLLPPSNLHSTQHLNIKENLGNQKNSVPVNLSGHLKKLSVQQYDEFEDTQKEDSVGVIDFTNQISPSMFNMQNQRIDIDDQISQVPTKPKIYKKKKTDGKKQGKKQDNGSGSGGDGSGNQEDNDEQPPERPEFRMQGQDDDEFEGQYTGDDQPVSQRINRQNTDLQRYQSQKGGIDYDSIILNQNKKNRIKQLQQIYLQRVEVRKVDTTKNRKRTQSKASHIP